MNPMRLLVVIAFGVAACVAMPSPSLAPEACTLPHDGLLVRSGKLVIDHGDRLVPAKADKDPQDAYFLVRDAEYIRVMDSIYARRLTLLLKPVDACSLAAGSSERACIYQGKTGKAYLIQAYCRVG